MSWVWQERYRIELRDGTQVSFEPLGRESLDEAMALAESIFAHVRGLSRPAFAFRASLGPSNPFALLRDPSGFLCRALARGMGVADMSYRITRTADGRVVGFNGHYVNVRDPFVNRYPEACRWGGWSGLAPDLRGRSGGLTIFWDLISSLRTERIRYLRIFATTHSDEAKANGMYENWGARPIHTARRSPAPKARAGALGAGRPWVAFPMIIKSRQIR